ncbi:MAG: hypothetical protein KAI24_25510 [Planctomycetes bacterium]|nr:hypothetical protein [Planctomycetota bacterium]
MRTFEVPRLGLILLLIAAGLAVWLMTSAQPDSSLLPTSGSPVEARDSLASSVEMRPPQASSPPFAREGVGASRAAPESGTCARFSGWVVDSRGNPCQDNLVKCYPLAEVAVGDRSQERGASTDDRGAFAIDFPVSYRDEWLGVAISAFDRGESALLKARAQEGQTFVVESRLLPESRLRGKVYIRGPAEHGHWLMPLTSARAIIAGGEYSNHTIDLASVGLNLERQAWSDTPFDLAVLTSTRSPAACRRFADQAAFAAWLATHPEIHVEECVVEVPDFGGRAIDVVEYGLRDIPQFGVVWWGKARPQEGRFRCIAEPGTRFVAVARLAGRSGTAVGDFAADSHGPARVQWRRGLAGPGELSVRVVAPTALRNRQLDVHLVPLLDDGSRIQARSAWRAGKARSSAGQDPSLLVAVFRDLAEGRYEVQVSLDRRIKARQTVQVPGESPLVTLGGLTSVLFAFGARDGLDLESRIDVRFAPSNALDRVHSARLPTGIGGFEGFAVHDVAPGEYAFCVRRGERYGEGRFTVRAGDTIVQASCANMPVHWVEGVLAPGVRRAGVRVVVAGATLARPWLTTDVVEGGRFRIGVPTAYRDAGLCVIVEGVEQRLQRDAAGQWDVDK